MAVLTQLRARAPILTMGLGSVTSAESVRRTLVASIGEQQASRVPVRALQELLDNVETVASANKSLSWHVHLSGYDETGKVFWLPVWEDVAVLQTSARRVLSMVYRFIESGPCMVGASFALLSKPVKRSADVRPTSGSYMRGKTRAPTTASPGGPASRAGTLSQPPGVTAGPADEADGGKEGEDGEDVTGGTPREGTVAAAAASSVAGGAAGAFSTLGAAQPSGAAGVAAETEAVAGTYAAAGAASARGGPPEEMASGEAGKSPAIKPASGDGGTLDAGDFIEEAAAKAAAAAAAAAAAIAGDGSSSSSSSSARRNAGRVKGVSRTAGHAAKARAGSRIIPVCPVSEHPPPAMTPSPEAENTALELFEKSKCPLTHLRAALTVASKAIAQGLSIRRARLSLPWWPLRPGSKELWPLRVIVKNDVVLKADARHRPRKGVQTVKILMFQASRARSASVAERVADLLLQMTKEPRALAAVGSFVGRLDRAMLLKTGSSRVPRVVAVADIEDGLGRESEEEPDVGATTVGFPRGGRGMDTTPLDAAFETRNEAADVPNVVANVAAGVASLAADVATTNPAVGTEGGSADTRAGNATEKATVKQPAVPRRVPAGGAAAGSLEGEKLPPKGKRSAEAGGFSSASVRAALEATAARRRSDKDEGTLRKTTPGGKPKAKSSSSSAAATKTGKGRAAPLPGAVASSSTSKDALTGSGSVSGALDSDESQLSPSTAAVVAARRAAAGVLNLDFKKLPVKRTASGGKASSFRKRQDGRGVASPIEKNSAKPPLRGLERLRRPPGRPAWTPPAPAVRPGPINSASASQPGSLALLLPLYKPQTSHPLQRARCTARTPRAPQLHPTRRPRRLVRRWRIPRQSRAALLQQGWRLQAVMTTALRPSRCGAARLQRRRRPIAGVWRKVRPRL